ncbi:MAG: class B sortase [Oscillospiraceae bacterium]|nr:class B sortase [Oscillospiraceae bacterium]
MKAFKLAIKILIIFILLFTAGICLFFVYQSYYGDDNRYAPIDVTNYTFHNSIQLPDNAPIISENVNAFEPFGTVDTIVLENLNKYYKNNSDVVAWIKIGNSKINFPVVQYSDNDYYLRRGYDKNYNFQGVIWADYRNTVTNRKYLAPNTVIYGHNTSDNAKTGKMFAQLMNYTNIEFAKANPVIELSSFTDGMRWQVFAAFYTDTNFYYIDTHPSKATMNTLISEAISRSEFDFGVPVTSSDKIITLSTCTYKYGKREDQRFVVMAKLLGANESPIANEVVANPNPKPPQFN